MKRLFTLFCAAGLLLALAACGRQAEEPASTLKPHVFSAETETIIDLLTETNEAFCLYDYDVDETIRSCRTTLWFYENGAWVSKAQSAGNLSAQQGQFGFYLDRNGSYTGYDIQEDGHTAYCYEGSLPVFEESAPSGSSVNQNEQEIVPGQEICLYVRLRAPDGADTVAFSTESFRSYPCSAGCAVTITLYDTLLPEDP